MDKGLCENCLKEVNEVFEVRDKFICQDCLEKANERYELLYEDSFRGIDNE